jgi:outer membrane lipoprotein-sorting protein
MFAPLVLVLALPAAEPNEAEKLFREMEAKLTKAKTLECVSTIQEKGKPDYRVSLVLAEGNKCRVELTRNEDRRILKSALISDGAKYVLIDGDDAKPAAVTPAWMNGYLRFFVVRFGGHFAAFAATSGFERMTEDPMLEKDIVPSDFKLGNKEKVGEQEAQVIEYTIPIPFSEDKPHLIVWIDLKTRLPLKRVLTIGDGYKKETLTETFTKLNLDEKIDPKQFELPKK